MRHSVSASIFVSAAAVLGLGALGAGATGCGDDAPSGVTGTVEGGVSFEGGISIGDDAGGNPPPEPGPPCGTADAKAGASKESITVSGAKRTFDLVVPDGYDGRKTYPLVMVFHGDGGTGANLRSYFKIEDAAEGGAIFVYPDGLNKTWVIDNASGIGKDISFVDEMAASLAKSHCVDTKKVFAVGFSKGAYFTNMLGCLAKTPLRAIVTHAGGGPFGLDGSGTKFDNTGKLVCPSGPVAALQVQGESDGSVPLSEGLKAREYWTRVNGCTTTTKPFEPSPCVAYDGCGAATPEVWCQIPSLGHTIWPTNGVKVTWDFIKSK